MNVSSAPRRLRAPRRAGPRREDDRLGQWRRWPARPRQSSPRPRIARQRSTCVRASSSRPARRGRARGRAGPRSRSSRRRRRRRSPARVEQLGRRVVLPAQVGTRAARWSRGPTRPSGCRCGGWSRVTRAASASTLVPAPVPEADQRLERVRDPGRPGVGQQPARLVELAARGVAAAEAVGDLLPVGRRSDVGQRQRTLEEAPGLVRGAEPPRHLAADVRRHPGEERALPAVGDRERALHASRSPRAGRPRRSCASRRPRRARPQHLVPELLGDLHRALRGLDPARHVAGRR